MRIRRGEASLDLFSTVTTIDLALDVTLQELRVESLFAADEASAQQLSAIVSS